MNYCYCGTPTTREDFICEKHHNNPTHTTVLFRHMGEARMKENNMKPIKYATQEMDEAHAEALFLLEGGYFCCGGKVFNEHCLPKVRKEIAEHREG